MNVETGYIQILIQTIITFFILLLFTRLLGKKQLSQLTFFNYITGITIGSITAGMATLNGESYMKELFELAIWCALTALVGYIGLKSPKMRVVLDGEPTILIKKGIIDERALSSTRLNLDDLSMMLRQQEIFSLKEVDYAILEPNGTLSVLKKPPYQKPQKSDLNLTTTEPTHIPTEVITDGNLVKRNLIELGLTEEWLNNELMNAKVQSVSDVFYAEIQDDGSLYVQKRCH